MKMLMLSPLVPFPPVGGGALRTFHLLRALSRKHELTLAAFRLSCAPPETPPFPIKVHEVAREEPELYRRMRWGDEAQRKSAVETLSFQSDEPWIVSWYESPQMENLLRDLSIEEVNVIIIEGSFMGRFLPALPKNVPKVLDLHNVHALMEQRAAEKSGPEKIAASRRELERTLAFERWVASECSLWIGCSAKEAAAAAGLLGIHPVHVVPNGVDSTFFKPPHDYPEEEGGVLFVGTLNYKPNVDAAEFFCKRILPLVKKEAPSVAVHIVGARPGPEILRLAGEGVEIHGGVPDLRPFYRMAAVVVVPLLEGGGTRLKVVEAAACGKAIVSTSIGAEGLDFMADRDIVLADSPEDFSGAVIRLLGDRPRRQELGRNARAASCNYDWQPIGEKFCQIIEDLAHTPRLTS